MKRIALFAVLAAAAFSPAGSARADWTSLTYGGHQPWWNPMRLVNNCGMNCEERKLQRFWHDYYAAQRRYYHSLSHLDWLTYYKNHGQVISGGGYPGCQGPPPVQYAPVTVAPQMSWASPQGAGYYPGMGMGAGGMGGGMMPASYAAPMAYPGYGVPSMGSGLTQVGYYP